MKILLTILTQSYPLSPLAVLKICNAKINVDEIIVYSLINIMYIHMPKFLFRHPFQKSQLPSQVLHSDINVCNYFLLGAHIFIKTILQSTIYELSIIERNYSPETLF